MLRDPEQVRELLELRQKAHDDFNPSRTKDLEKFAGSIWGTFEPYLIHCAKKFILKYKGYLPVSQKYKKIEVDGRDKLCLCSTIHDDYVANCVESFISTRIILYKCLKNCTNVKSIITGIKYYMEKHVLDMLKKENKIDKIQNPSSLDLAKYPGNTKYRDCYNNEILDPIINKQLIAKTIVPKQFSQESIYKQKDGLIHENIEKKLSDEYVEKPDEIMEKMELIKIIEKNFTENTESDPIGTKVIEWWLSNHDITNKQIAQKIREIFPESEVTEGAIKQILSSKPERYLHKFISKLLKRLKVNKSTDEVIECLRKVNKISKEEAMKKKQENENGGEEL